MITSSIKIKKSATFFGCFLVVFWIIFKDLFRGSLYFGIPDFGILVFLCGLIVSLLAVVQGLRVIKLSVFDITVVMYIFYSSAVTLAHTLLYNSYSFTSYQILIVLSFQLVSMLLLLFFSLKSPEVLVMVTNHIVRYAFFACVFLASILVIFVIADLNLVFHLYGQLLELGIIVNPFQTSEQGIAVRFSGIFYSALNFGLFIAFCIIISFGGEKSSRLSFSVLAILALLLLSSFNRNAMATLAFSSLAISLHRIGFQKFHVLLFIVFGLVSLVFALSFIVNMGSSIDQSNSFILSAHSLYSRLEVWGYWINSLDFRSLIYGYGVVAGMGDDHLYIDNGFIFLVVNSGIISLFFFISHLVFLSIKGSKTFGADGDIAFYLIVGLPIAMLFNNVVLDPMLMLLFFFYPIALIKRAQLCRGDHGFA